MATEVRLIADSFRNERRKIIAHEDEYPTLEGRLFMVFLERWGMVAADSTTEDSSGRGVTKALPVAEVVNRAAEMTQLAAATLREKAWLVKGPSADEYFGPMELPKDQN